MSKNTRLQKISRFGPLFEKSIFPPHDPQPWGLREKLNFQKDFPNHMNFCIQGVFRHGELESEGIF